MERLHMAEQARLMVQDGTGTHPVVLETIPFSIGRNRENQLVLSDADVSRQHAEITRDGDRYILTDRNSRFGTYVNGRKIEGPHALAHGDHIQVGTTARPPLEFQIVSSEITRTMRAGGGAAGGGATTSSTVAGGTIDGLDPAALRAGSGSGGGRSMDMLGKALNALVEGRVLEEVLGIVVDQAIQLSGAERGFVMLAGADGRLEIRMARGRRGFQLEDSAFRHSEKIPQEVFGTGRLVYKDDLFETAGHEHTAEIGIRSALCCPLPRVRGLDAPTASVAEALKPLGAIYVDSRGRGRLAARELHTAFEQLAAEAAVAIEYARLVGEAQEKARIEQELRLAAGLQQALLPPPRLVSGPFELAGLTIPCRAVGGDFYEYTELAGGRLGFALGDVSGKGPPAALMAALIQGILASHAEDEKGPGATLARLNRTLVSRSVGSRFATMAFAVAEPGGRLAVSNAGHNPTYVVRADGRLEGLDKGGLPLGIFPEADYEQETIGLEPDDTVVLFSDGVTEAANRAQDQFEDERLRACLSGARGLPPEQVLDRIVDAVNEFVGDEAQADDITVLVVRYRGQPAD
jgi:serine phosphatase RsbU (regulator of sigma subunit)